MLMISEHSPIIKTVLLESNNNFHDYIFNNIELDRYDDKEKEEIYNHIDKLIKKNAQEKTINGKFGMCIVDMVNSEHLYKERFNGELTYTSTTNSYELYDSTVNVTYQKIVHNFYEAMELFKAHYN